MFFYENKYLSIFIKLSLRKWSLTVQLLVNKINEICYKYQFANSIQSKQEVIWLSRNNNLKVYDFNYVYGQRFENNLGLYFDL